PKTYLLAILAAEHLLKMVPKGTHDYKTFIKPSELCQSARIAGLELHAFTGIQYNPFNKQFSLGRDIDVNYIAAFKRPE
ncbi:MAG: bifunctional 3-demethylubiquinol 3-O-methyltransferase/2-polyprenyl-6-hydroxyphenol methylase, partial [Methylomonas sp.]|nr:bifunctional 3-demethylubiquinol 3-O-methyltransferase/2-polyprenyl-6-hydroxyphenol methylase [Methylomonas sp.]